MGKISDLFHRFFSKQPRETSYSKSRRVWEEWYVHNTGIDECYLIQEMINLGYLSKPKYEMSDVDELEAQLKSKEDK